MTKRKQKWFLRQPVGVRAALIGAVATVLVGIFSLLASLFPVFWHLENDTQAIEKNIAERGVILLELGYTIYISGLVITASIPDELDVDRVHHELKVVYSRLDLPFPDAEVGPTMFKNTRSMLVSERDKHFLDIGMYLAAAYSTGIVMIAHRNTYYERQGRKQMSTISNKLRTTLRALRLLEPIEQDRMIEDFLLPKVDDSTETYLQTLVFLKGAIVGEIRHQYGT